MGWGYSRSQEISIVLARHLAREVLRGQVELVALGRLPRQLVGLLLEELERVGPVHTLALGRGHAVADPLPQLAAGHLGGGGVLPIVTRVVVSLTGWVAVGKIYWARWRGCFSRLTEGRIWLLTAEGEELT